MVPLIKKELKEHAKWISVGLLVMLVLAWAATPTAFSSFTWGDSHRKLISYLGFASAIFAVFLGLIQTVWDFSDRNRGYLLHRAVSLNVVLMSKIFSGAIVYFTVTLIPLLLVAAYLAVKGIEQLPTRPLQVVPALMVTCLCYFFHPATMWMVIRPAKWYGTKLLPLCVPALICFAYASAVDNSWVSWMFFAVCLFILIGVGCSLVANTLRPITLIASSSIAVAFAVFLMVVVLEGVQKSTVSINPYDRVGSQLGSDRDGNLWLYNYRSSYDEEIGQYRVSYVSGSKVEPDSLATIQGKLPDGFEANWVTSQFPMTARQKRYGAIDFLYSMGKRLYMWDERGYILVYELTSPSGLVGTISRDGFTKGSVPVGRRFAGKPNQFGFSGVQQAFTNPEGQVIMRSHLIWGDQEGLYLLDASSNRLEVVVNQPIRAMYSLRKEENMSMEFLCETDSELRRYKSNISVGSTETPLSVELIASYPKLPILETKSWSIAAGAEGQLVAIDSTFSEQARIAKIASPQQLSWDVSQVVIQQNNTRNYLQEVTFGFVPPIVVAAFSGLIAMIQYAHGEKFLQDLAQVYPSLPYVLMAMTVSILIAMVLVIWLSRNRGLGKGRTIGWVAGCIPLALAAPLAMVAIHGRLAFERCPRCEKQRRVDRLRCEHCGAEWESPTSQGIEIYEASMSESFVSAS